MVCRSRSIALPLFAAVISLGFAMLLDLYDVGAAQGRQHETVLLTESGTEGVVAKGSSGESAFLGNARGVIGAVSFDPECLLCADRSASASFALSLTPSGRAYFGVHANDVEAAIAAAVDDAQDQIVWDAANVQWCEDRCAALQGNGEGEEEDATALSQLIIGAFCKYDPLCDPAGVGPIGPGLSIAASAPGRMGVDLQPLLESVQLGAVPGLPSVYVDAFEKWRNDVFNELELVVVPSSVTQVSTLLQPSGYTGAGWVSITANPSSGTLGISIIVPSSVPTIGNTYPLSISCVMIYGGGDWSPGGIVSTGGLWDDGLSCRVFWDGGDTEEVSPGVLPGLWWFKNDTNPSARSVYELIPLSNSLDAETYVPQDDYNDNPLHKLVPTGEFTIEYDFYRIPVDPEFEGSC